jgi:hypothetical protein
MELLMRFDMATDGRQLMTGPGRGPRQPAFRVTTLAGFPCVTVGGPAARQRHRFPVAAGCHEGLDASRRLTDTSCRKCRATSVNQHRSRRTGATRCTGKWTKFLGLDRLCRAADRDRGAPQCWHATCCHAIHGEAAARISHALPACRRRMMHTSVTARAASSAGAGNTLWRCTAASGVMGVAIDSRGSCFGVIGRHDALPSRAPPEPGRSCRLLLEPGPLQGAVGLATRRGVW